MARSGQSLTNKIADCPHCPDSRSLHPKIIALLAASCYAASDNVRAILERARGHEKDFHMRPKIQRPILHATNTSSHSRLVRQDYIRDENKREYQLPDRRIISPHEEPMGENPESRTEQKGKFAESGMRTFKSRAVDKEKTRKSQRIDRTRLRMLCSRLESSDACIAKRFGVTREAIRRARNRLRIPGRGLERVKMLKEWRKQYREHFRRGNIYARNPFLREMERRTARLNLGFEILVRSPFGRWIRIGGAVCYLFKAGSRQRADNPDLSYVVLYRPRMNHDFTFAIVKLARGWMLIPRDQLPAGRTEFVLGRKKSNPGTNCSRRDWANYYYPSWDWLGTIAK